MKPSTVWSILCFILFISCDNTDDSTPQPLEAQIVTNVSYGAHPQQVYDLYLPQARAVDKTKVIVLVHGGGWTEGDKDDMSGIITLIQNTHPDHAIVNMNYVLATQEQPAFPHQFLDVGRVISKITEEANTLQIQPEFGLVGLSAGAHLSLMYDYVYDTTDAVKFVADIVGPTDFTHPFYTENPNFEILLSLLVDQNQYPPNTNYAEAVSPLYQVSNTSSPTILFYGNQDELVPLDNGEDLKDALLNQNIQHSFTIYNGGHGNWDAASYLDVQQKLSGFIDAHLAIEE